MFLSLFFFSLYCTSPFFLFFIFLSACLLFNSLLLCTITPPHTPIHIALLLANKPTKKMESQDPKAASLILKFKEAAKAAEDFEYSDDDEDDDNEEEEDEVAGFRLIGVERNGEVVKKKKLVVSDTGSGKKRANVTGGGGGGMAAVCCQVEKCGTDLKEVKRYYRRHKVCEVHAKSPLVVVGGIRQRFCQQCSRFHELSEFDEMRRSCRSRLAGHNERRRKLSSETHREAASSHEGDRITIATARPGKHIQFH